ncbi:MAG: FHA domain-containing protein [Thermoguttaceae bacterium]
MAEQLFGELVPLGGGDRHVLTKTPVTIGRSSRSDIVLPFSNVSSRHCRLVLSEGYWYIQDLNSTNGVRVNGMKVSDRRVDPGDTLTIARCQLMLQYSPTQLGATGIPPREVLDNAAVFSGSLLQKAGLAAKTEPKSSSSKDMESTDLVDSAESSSTINVESKRNYFDDLKF